MPPLWVIRHQGNRSDSDLAVNGFIPWAQIMLNRLERM
jgi:hypothetical protein